jgi:hypothetical protein
MEERERCYSFILSRPPHETYLVAFYLRRILDCDSRQADCDLTAMQLPNAVLVQLDAVDTAIKLHVDGNYLAVSLQL